MTTKTTNILYWIALILLSIFLLSSAIPAALSLDFAIAHFHDLLGYPVYFLPFTGITKIIGVIILFIPGYPRIKEWIFAGLVFDLVAALYSHLATNNAEKGAVPITIGLIFLIVVYILYRKKLTSTPINPSFI